MFRKVLYPTDFSEYAKKALKYVKELEKVGAEVVVVLNVIEKSYTFRIVGILLLAFSNGDIENDIQPIEKAASG